MAFFLMFILWTAIYFVAELIRPKPKFEESRPSGLCDFRFPTATEGRAVPLIWGTVKVEGPNVIWYGDLRNEPILEVVRTGMFSSDEIITGYFYILGMQFAICRAEATLTKVYVDDRVVFSGSISTVTGLSIVDLNLFGGNTFGTGGISGTLRWHPGSPSQAVNSYLDGLLGIVPNYRGTSMAVWEGGYIGNATSIQPWSFEVQRLPDGLNMAVEDPGTEVVNTFDCNLMNVIYEIMTDTDWGLAIAGSDIDLTNFRAAASTLAGEGNGFSMVLDSEREASVMIDEVVRQADGALFFNRETGLWQIKLARADYTPASLDTYDESNITKLTNYSRQTWEETTNQVRALFDKRDENYKQSYGLAQDMANVQIQGGNISADVNFPGVKDKTLANALAWRELKTLSYPLAKINFMVDRVAFDKTPGDVFNFSWARLGISKVPFRIGRIDYGTLEDEEITIYAIQDIFAAGAGVFGDPIGSGWTEPDAAPVAMASTDFLAFEAPRQMIIQDPFSPAQTPRVWRGGRNPGGGTITFQGQNRDHTTRPMIGTFEDDGTVTSFLLRSTVATEIAAYPNAGIARPDPSVLTFKNNDPDDILASAASGTFNESEVRTLSHIAYLGDITDQASLDGEFIGWNTLLNGGGGNFIMLSTFRGLFHTTPKIHPVGTDIWFIGLGGNLSTHSFFFTTDEFDARLLSRGRFTTTDGTSDPVIEIHMDRVDIVPLAPRYPTLNGTFKDSVDVDLDADYATETGFSLPDGRAIELNVIPRFWRVNDILDDEDVTTLQQGVDYDDDSPTFDFEVTMDPGGSPVTIPAYVVSGSPDVDDPTVYVLRNDAIIALGSGTVVPTSWRFEVVAKHTVDVVVQTNPIKLLHDFTVVSALLITHDQLTWGGFAVNVWSDTQTAATSETYNFDIYTALPSSGILEGRIDGGSPVTIVAASATTGSIVMAVGETLELRFDQAPVDDQFFDFNRSAGADEGYGVLES